MPKSNYAFQIMLSERPQAAAMQQSESRHLNAAGHVKPDRKQEIPGRYEAAGDFGSKEPKAQSISADIDGAQAIAERREDPARHIAAVIHADADVTDAEAVAPVVMMMKAAEAAAESAAARGSGGGSQRYCAEGSCGNQCKSEFA
jgi:hypothetical protein